MSHDLNQCNFIGRLGKDPERKAMPSGTVIANVSLAVGWKSKDKEGTEWVRVVFFDKLAETVCQYLKKGSQVYVTGRLRTTSWDKDGVKQYMTEIHAERMQMLGGKAEYQRQDQMKPEDADADKDKGFDDDIPF